MPYASERQRRYMYARHPAIAKRWDREGKNYVRSTKRQTRRKSHMPGPPTIFSAVLDHPRRDEYDLSSLRQAIIGAASIPAVLVHRMRDELGIESILSAYGLTENHALVSLTAPDDPPDVVATTVGRPLPSVEVRVVDDAGNDLPAGMPGELFVSGPFQMSA